MRVINPIPTPVLAGSGSKGSLRKAKSQAEATPQDGRHFNTANCNLQVLSLLGDGFNDLKR